MKKVALLAMLFGASVSMLTHADTPAYGTDSTQQAQPGSTTNTNGTTDPAGMNSNSSGNMNTNPGTTTTPPGTPGSNTTNPGTTSPSSSMDSSDDDTSS